MKQNALLLLSALVLSSTLTSCELVEGVFKAGFWSAIILIVLVVVLILWLIGRSRR